MRLFSRLDQQSQEVTRLRGLALSGGCDGSLRATDRRLVDEAVSCSRTRVGCDCHGSLAPPPRCGAHHSFGSGLAVGQRRLPTLLQCPPPEAEHEPPSELLGQCRCGVILRQLEERKNSKEDLSHPRAGKGGSVRLHRDVLQSYQAPQLSRWRQSRGLRGGFTQQLLGGGIRWCLRQTRGD